MATTFEPPSLMTLPPEIHLVISDHLPFYTQHALRLTSTYFHNIIPAVASEVSPSDFELVQDWYQKKRWPSIASSFDAYAQHWNVVTCNGCAEIWSSPKHLMQARRRWVPRSELEVVKWGTTESCPKCELLKGRRSWRRMNTWK